MHLFYKWASQILCVPELQRLLIPNGASLLIFGSYDHLMIVYPVYVFYDQQPFCLVTMRHSILEKRIFKMTTPSKPLKQYDSYLVQMLHG